MSQLRTPSLLQLALVLSLAICLVPCKALSSFVALDMRNPEKCVMVNYPLDTRLEVLYEILDPKKDKLSMGIKLPDSLLSQTRVNFLIKPAPQSTMPTSTINTLKHEVTEIAGKVTFKGEGEGLLQVCVRIDEMPGRKYIKPALIAFRLKESGEMEAEDVTEVTVEEKKGQEAAKDHLSEMERILSKMIREANLLLKNADSVKNDEAAFFKQSKEMNAASKWWPMLHVVVLLVMGFTQANHVVKFFKGKHII